MECKACGYQGDHFRKLIVYEKTYKEFDTEKEEVIAYACPCCGTMRIDD